MIETICDVCNKMVGTEAYYVTVTEISNLSRYSIGATEVPKIECQRQASMVVCPSCYSKMKLPTIDNLKKKDDKKWEE